jgi:hypothetical protein
MVEYQEKTLKRVFELLSKQTSNKEQTNMDAQLIRHPSETEPPHLLASRTVAEQGLTYLCQLTADLQAAQDRINLLESDQARARIERDDAVREAAKLKAIIEALCLVMDKYRGQ